MGLTTPACAPVRRPSTLRLSSPLVGFFLLLLFLLAPATVEDGCLVCILAIAIDDDSHHHTTAILATNTFVTVASVQRLPLLFVGAGVAFIV